MIEDIDKLVYCARFHYGPSNATFCRVTLAVLILLWNRSLKKTVGVSWHYVMSVARGHIMSLYVY